MQRRESKLQIWVCQVMHPAITRWRLRHAVLCCAAHVQEAEKNKGVILEAVKGAPEPVREIAETAVAAHSREKLLKGAVIHDFCLGITFGTPCAWQSPFAWRIYGILM